jgi:hypothetical protein
VRPVSATAFSVPTCSACLSALPILTSPSEPEGVLDVLPRS